MIVKSASRSSPGSLASEVVDSASFMTMVSSEELVNSVLRKRGPLSWLPTMATIRESSAIASMSSVMKKRSENASAQMS